MCETLDAGHQERPSVQQHATAKQVRKIGSVSVEIDNVCRASVSDLDFLNDGERRYVAHSSLSAAAIAVAISDSNSLR